MLTIDVIDQWNIPAIQAIQSEWNNHNQSEN